MSKLIVWSALGALALAACGAESNGGPSIPAMPSTNAAAGSGGAPNTPNAMNPAATAGTGSTNPMTPVATAGAGSSNPMTPVTPTPGNLPMLDPATPYDQVPANCRGLELVGLKYSPGGDVLPNKCAPFHGAFNNPYAIRCIDANPAFDSGYPGDEWCVLPPAPENGTQIHVGPESYTSPGTGFLMEPGEEITNYYFVNAPNAEQHYYYRTNWRMRNGSHHMIITVMNDRADGWSATGDIGGAGGGSRSFGGAQRPDQDRPSGTLAISPENQDLGERLDAKQQFSFNLHHFNLTNGPIVREVWVNVWYKPQAEVKREIDGISIFGNPADLNIPNGEHRYLHYRCDVPGNTRIMTLNGHRHAWTDRFGVWLIRIGLDRRGPDLRVVRLQRHAHVPVRQRHAEPGAQPRLGGRRRLQRHPRREAGRPAALRLRHHEHVGRLAALRERSDDRRDVHPVRLAHRRRAVRQRHARDGQRQLAGSNRRARASALTAHYRDAPSETRRSASQQSRWEESAARAARHRPPIAGDRARRAPIPTAPECAHRST